MPRRRKGKEPEYTSVVATIDTYDVETHASINNDMDAAFREFADDEAPVFTFETDLTIRATCTEPTARKGHAIELTLLSPAHLSRRLRYRIKQFRKTDDDGTPIYKKYRDGEFPVYEKPPGIARIDKVRGEDQWPIWMQVAPQMTSDTLLTLASGKQVWLWFQEKKEDRQRWVEYLSVQTKAPEEE